jgi:hypothetical protein
MGSNPAFERIGQQLRFWLPSALRASASVQREGLGPLDTRAGSRREAVGVRDG